MNQDSPGWVNPPGLAIFDLISGAATGKGIL
jgi:hypothetical protein